MNYIKNRTPFFWIYLTIVFTTIYPLFYSLWYEHRREEDFVFALFIGLLLVFPLYFIKHKRIYLGILFPILFLPSLLDTLHISLYQGRITSNIFFILFDSNPAEAKEYISGNISWALLWKSVPYIVITLFLWTKLFRIPSLDIQTKRWRFALLWLLLPLLYRVIFGYLNQKPVFESYFRASDTLTFIQSYFEYKNEMALVSKQSEKIVKHFNIKRTKQYDKELHVLVIGESTSAMHMGIYGYYRNTTPRLEAMRKEIHIFEDVFCSEPPNTLSNVGKIVSFANNEDYSEANRTKILLNVMNAAGFSTYWLSNQQILSESDTGNTVFAKQAKKSIFTNTTEGDSFDEKLFPYIDSVLAEPDPKKFIVIHLVGAHQMYFRRYPSRFNHFTTTEDIPPKSFFVPYKMDRINEYDNAILYGDFILSKIIEKLKPLEIRSSLLYLSDHGEEVFDSGDYNGHATKASLFLYKIPFILWLSNNFNRKIPLAYLQRKYVSDDVIHALLDLYDIQTDEVKLNKSIFHPSFIPKKRKF